MWNELRTNLLAHLPGRRFIDDQEYYSSAGLGAKGLHKTCARGARDHIDLMAHAACSSSSHTMLIQAAALSLRVSGTTAAHTVKMR